MHYLTSSWRRILRVSLLTGLLTLCWHPSVSLPEPPKLPLRARIGQMLLVCFEGTALPPDHPLRNDIHQRHLGGVMLRSRPVSGPATAGNIVSAPQLRGLTRSLQGASPTPLLIAVDQEGGQVRRLKTRAGFPPTTSFAELGRRNDLALTRQRSQGIAETLRRNGINFNFSPVVDLNRNPSNPVIGALERSFSPDPATVTAHAAQVVAAHRASGIATCLKHFPGHGSSATDSHHGFVDITATWSESELLPFADLIQANLADAVMTAHVFNGRLDRNYPATLSPAILTGLLRQNLGFRGVIISDDLRMDAISRYYSFGEALKRAINAGVDILLICDSDPATVADTVSVIHDLVLTGQISAQSIDQAYRRISLLKARLSVGSSKD